MKKIYLTKMRGTVVFLLRSISPFAKKYPVAAKVLDESGNRSPSLRRTLNCLGVGITTDRNANLSLTEDGKAVSGFSSFIQFTHPEFRSLN